MISKRAVYELRLYTIVPGRLDVAEERFGAHLPALFAKHGINNIGRWTATAGSAGPMFVYLLKYRDLAERERAWSSFWSDDAWYELRSRTQGDEEATERFDILFLRQSADWRPERPTPEALAGLHDLMFIELPVGKAAESNAFLLETYLPLMRSNGAEILLMTDCITGTALPKVALIVSWSDAEARRAGWLKMSTAETLTRAFCDQRRNLGRSLLGNLL